MKQTRILKSVLLLAAISLGAAPLSAATPKKLLVVTVTKGFRHSSIPTAEKVLAELGQKTGEFTLDYARTDQELAEKTTPAALNNYDGAIFANTTGMLPLADKDAFISWVKSGKAFIGMHSASDTFHEFEPYIQMVGAEFLTHHEQAKIQCLNQDLAHPATQHFGPVYEVFDEIYLFKNFHRDQVHGLLTLDKHPNTRMPGDYPITWTKRAGAGRVFYTELGHREDVWESEPYQKMILGGIEWATGLKFADATPQCTQPHLSAEEVRAGFIPMFNGENLDGWKLRRTEGKRSWSAQDGMLVNVLEKGEHGTDLISEDKFRDFTVRYEYMVPKGANSGFYLRGRYEIQIFDDYDSKKAQLGGNGAIYNVKAVSEFASKPAGEWQQVEATIRGNRITVFLNGVKIHDNVEVTHATGSEIDQNLGAPGPILLQGDHGAVAFRNIRIKLLN